MSATTGQTPNESSLIINPHIPKQEIKSPSEEVLFQPSRLGSTSTPTPSCEMIN